MTRVCVGLVVFLCAVSAAAASAADAQTPPAWTAGYDARTVTVSRDGVAPFALTVLCHPAWRQADRVSAFAADAVALFNRWFGYQPPAPFTLVVGPWNSRHVSVAEPGVAVVAGRWLSPERDVSLERATVAAVARQVWTAPGSARQEDKWFHDALVRYSGARAIEELLRGRHLETLRFFGGFVPYTVRSVALSREASDPRPAVRQFAELEQPPASSASPWMAPVRGPAQRAADGLHTIERLVGWPAMQQALAALRTELLSGHAGPDDFAGILGRQRGHDARWLVQAALRSSAAIDYGVDRVASSALTGRPAAFDTRVTVRRYGASLLSDDDASAGGAPAERRLLPIVTTFDDGTEVREWWDGRAPVLELAYISQSPAVRAAVDPASVVLLDANRMNNRRVLEADASVPGARMALNWMIWLQDAMLTYTSWL